MKHRLFLPALMCCLTLAAFGFFVFALVRDSMQGTPQKSFEGWYGQVLVPASELHDKLDRKYGFDSSPPPNHTNDRIIGFRFNLDHPEHAAEIARDLHEQKRHSPDLVKETFGVEVYLYCSHDGRPRWTFSREEIDPPLLVIRTMMPAPGRTEFQGAYQGWTSDVVIENGNGSVRRTFTPDEFYHPADGSDEAEAFIRALADALVSEVDETTREKALDADNEAMLTNQEAYLEKSGRSMFEILPGLFAATWFDFICAFVFFLFAIRYQNQEIGGRLFPLSLLTILHMLLFPSLDLLPLDHDKIAGTMAGTILFVLESAILFSPLLLFLFLLIYGSVLSKTKRMNRPLKIAFVLFAINVLIQGLIALGIWGLSQGG